MLTIAIETATVPGSVAIVEDQVILVSHAFGPKEQTAKWLAPSIKRLFSEIDRPVSELQLIALVIGPGSFTGLRIGVTTAKMLSYVYGCPIAGLNTLDVIAHQTTIDVEQLDVILNAQGTQLFVRRYVRSNDNWIPSGDVVLQSSQDWLQAVTAGNVRAVSGPGMNRLSSDQQAQLAAADCQVEPAASWVPQPATIARLGVAKLADNDTNDMWRLRPQYYRKSYAE